MRKLLCLALWVCLSCPAFAAEPKAVVQPPTQVEPGDIQVLDATSSTGDIFKWVSLSGKTAYPSESGKSAYFATGKPGKYQFLFIAAGVVDGKAKLDTATVELVVAAPPPAPSPSPTPDPTPAPAPATTIGCSGSTALAACRCWSIPRAATTRATRAPRW